MKSYFLVFVQFTLIFLMLMPLGTSSDTLFAGLVIMLIGGGVGFAALQKNSIGNFNIRPDIKEECRLIRSGIYGYIRHPMYSSVLLIMLGVLTIYPTRNELILYMLLLLTLLVKMFYEEHLWHCDGEEYREYAAQTKRLFPYVF
jgi:protein-S-isoprenylcysteine O-methyltransferase Ste14